MTKINITNQLDRDTMLSHILIEAMSGVTGPDGDAFELFHLEREKVGTWAEVKLTINGVECDLEEFAKCVEEQIDKMIETKASELIDEAKSGLEAKMDNLFADLKAKFGLRECTCHQYE